MLICKILASFSVYFGCSLSSFTLHDCHKSNSLYFNLPELLNVQYEL